jgi:ADP-ribose pyrophosphatase YjhB (NUDIX family)/ankyrin repeat protein
VEYFSMQGAQLEQVDASGDTVYFRVCDRLAGGFEQYLEENQTKLNDSIQLKLRISSMTALFSAQKVDVEKIRQDEIAALQQEWEGVRERLEKIKLFLESQNVKQERLPKTLAQQYKYTTFAGAGLVTTKLNGESHVLLVRKKNPHTNKPYGYFLAPGGYKDLTDASMEAAVCREILEETSLEVTDQAVINPYFIYEKTVGNTEYLAMHFFHIHLTSASLASLMAKDDVAEARWVKWSEIEQRRYENTICYFYNGIRINQSNAMLIERLLQCQTIDDALINQTLDVELANSEPRIKKMLQEGNLKEIRELYAQGIDFSKTSALMLACNGDNHAILDLLLELKTDVNVARRVGYLQITPLMVAASFGKLDVAKVLVEQGAMIDLMLCDSTALVCAISQKHQALVEYFIEEKQASLGQAIGHIALKAALSSGEVQALALLLSKGVDLWAENYRVMLYIKSCWEMAKSGVAGAMGITGEDLKNKTQYVLDHLESQTLNESQQALVVEIKALQATVSFEESSSPNCPIM